MKQNRQSGFSLIELLIVIAVMGIVTGIALPNLLEWSRGLKYKEAARTLASVLRDARARAVAENREYRVLIDVDGNSSVGTGITVPQYGYAIQKGRLASNSTAFGGAANEVVNGVTYVYANGWATVTAGGRPLISNQGAIARLVLRAGTACDTVGDRTIQFNPNGTSQTGYICVMDSSVIPVQRRFIVGIPTAGSGRVVVSR